MKKAEYEFLAAAGRVLNAGQSRTLILSGNIQDLFRLPAQPQGEFPTDGQPAVASEESHYVPLLDFLKAKWNVQNKIVIFYELNNPIRFLRDKDRETVRQAWLRHRSGGIDEDAFAIKNMLSDGKAKAEREVMSEMFDKNLASAIGNATLALDLLRQMCLCSRAKVQGRPLLSQGLIILIEAADMLLPEGPISNLRDSDRQRVSICHDWFSDPGFMNGDDSVVLIAESRALIHHRIARLPQIIDIEIPSPDDEARKTFINWFIDHPPKDQKLRLWSSRQELVKFTAGLSIHALMQLMKGAAYEGRVLTLNDVIDKVEDYIQSQLGDDIVEFKKPGHRLDDIVGFANLKRFIRDELIPRFRATGAAALTGAAVSGPIGGGKTFIFEAVASELDMVVLVLKNIRSKWFGETDVIFERLRRVLNALAKVLIFVDEADTQFGGVGEETQATERRLTGKIQSMMSDPELRGRVIWLLMTARIHLLSPDIRRPGRAGDLILPVLDPGDEDRQEFLRWMVKPVLGRELTEEELDLLDEAVHGDSAASFASLRSELKAKVSPKKKTLEFQEILLILNDLLPPAITKTRRYQTLQALANCTRRSLLPNPSVTDAEREAWETEIRALEAEGVR